MMKENAKRNRLMEILDEFEPPGPSACVCVVCLWVVCVWVLVYMAPRNTPRHLGGEYHANPLSPAGIIFSNTQSGCNSLTKFIGNAGHACLSLSAP